MSHVLLMYSDGPPSDAHVSRLRALAGVERVTVAGSEPEALEAAKTADVFVGQRYLRQCLPVADKVRWVQSTAGGVDHLLTPELHHAGPMLARCPIFSEAIARHALAMAMAVSRRLPDSIDSQRAARWRKTKPLSWPTSAMVIGVGTIGSSLARLLKAVGIRVTGVKRSFSPADFPVDIMLGQSEWRRALSATDWLFPAIPGRPANRHFVDAQALAALPPHAVVVNVGHGTTVDTEALAAQLRAGLLGGAALDVTEPDPLPDDHWLWRVPNLLITPKVATLGPDRKPRLESFVERQVARYLRGEAPEHLVEYAPSTRNV